MADSVNTPAFLAGARRMFFTAAALKIVDSSVTATAASLTTVPTDFMARPSKAYGTLQLRTQDQTVAMNAGHRGFLNYTARGFIVRRVRAPRRLTATQQLMTRF